MAFDENYHFGLIQLYAQQWTPFFAISPEATGAFGDITRDPSYLFHYVMSFPYRLISLFTDQMATQVVILRIINVGLFTGGLLLFSRLITNLGVSQSIRNLILFLFCLIPVVPFLAAQINYDNLLFLLLPLTLLVTLQLVRELRKNTITPISLILFLSLLCVSSLVKYPFLPIAAALFVSVIITYFRQPRSGRRLIRKKLFHTIKMTPRHIKILLIVGCIISAGLFVERDIKNVISYGTPSPSCTDIQPLEYCLQYAPFKRNYNYAQETLNSGMKGDTNIFVFTGKWLYGMIYRLFFAINYNYSNYLAPAPIFITALFVASSGLVASLWYGRRVIQMHWFWPTVMAAMTLYIGALFYTNYSESITLGRLVAVNGRYLIIFLPLMMVFAALALQMTLGTITTFITPRARLILQRFGLPTVIGLICLISLQGGLTTYIIRSDDSWYWDNSTVQSVNQSATQIVTPLVIDLPITFGQP